MTQMTPREIVSELDKHIIGQHDAKRAVAIALRNRWRRQQVPEPLRHEITPKNILMIGPTGVGKTEIARRLAKLAQSPFVKVEASKFTEVGYVGRDVESMIRDLVEIAIDMVREERLDEVSDRAEKNAEDRLIELAHSDRSKTPIEPYLADQWFIRMDELAEPALQVGELGTVLRRDAGGTWTKEKSGSLGTFARVTCFGNDSEAAAVNSMAKSVPPRS